MKDVFKAAWDAFEIFAKNNENKVVLVGNKDEFAESCCVLYNKFIDKYMKKDSPSKSNSKIESKNNSVDAPKLDRHKIGAIISIVGSRNYFKPKNDNGTDQLFIGKYTIPISVGLQLVIDDTNADLKEFGFLNQEKTDIKMYIPKPKVCKTNYIVSIARNLIFEEQSKVDDLLRVLELANVFFLMEECTLLFEKVPMNEWLEFKRNQRN